MNMKFQVPCACLSSNTLQVEPPVTLGSPNVAHVSPKTHQRLLHSDCYYRKRFQPIWLRFARTKCQPTSKSQTRQQCRFPLLYNLVRYSSHNLNIQRCVSFCLELIPIVRHIQTTSYSQRLYRIGETSTWHERVPKSHDIPQDICHISGWCCP